MPSILKVNFGAAELPSGFPGAANGLLGITLPVPAPGLLDDAHTKLVQVNTTARV